MSDSKTLEAVSGIDLFASLPGGQRSRLAEIALVRTMRRGEVLFQEGDPGEGLYSVISGSVRIFRAAPNGREHILHIFGPGDTFGEVAVFSGRTFPAHAESLKAGELLFIPRDRFKRLLMEEPELGLNMLGLMSQRLRHFVNKVDDLSLKEVPARLAAHLLLLRDAQEGSGRVALDMTKGRLASYLGTIPETLSRILRKFSDLGLIRQEGTSVVLIDEETLESLATGEEKLDQAG